MTKDAPAFDFFPERWLSGVAMFSDAEQLSYLRLLCHQWIMGGLPDNVTALKRLAGKGVTPELLRKFPVGDDGQRRNARLEIVRAEQRERIIKRRLGSALTNAARYGFDSLSDEDKALVLASPKGRQFLATTLGSEVGSEVAKTSLTPRHHPPPTTHPISSPHTQSAGAYDPGFWPDPREYPALSVVEQWADASQTPAECAAKWHAERVAEGWQTRNSKPLNPDLGALRNLFLTYATAWKARVASIRQAASQPRPQRPADESDVKASNMKIL